MNPVFLLAKAKELVHQLQQKYEYLQKNQQQILEELEKQFIERQQIITDARKARRDDDDFAEQMRELYDQEERLKRKLAVIEQEVTTYAGMDWEVKVNDYVADLQAGIEELNSAAPQTPEDQHHVFLLKKRLVDEFVAEAMIDGKRDIQVKFRANIIDLAGGEKGPDLPNDGEIVVQL